MIFQFRIISDESKEFARELLIDSSSTFLDFHTSLQKDLHYDPNQLASFFLTSESWEKEMQITLIDMMDDSNQESITMDNAILGEHIKDKGQRLLYVFDFFSERAFFIELTEIFKDMESKALPKISFSHGEPPPQIDLGIDDLQIGEEDFGEDFLGDSFDDDDLSEGFDISGSDDYYEE